MQFEITFDYLCPFARNAAEGVISGLRDGRDWEVTFRPFSLSQAHVSEGDPDVFADPTASGILALHWGVAIRDFDPANFPTAHLALFAARHDHGLDISEESVLRSVLAGTAVDVDAVAGVVASGTPAETIAGEHREAVERWRVFGVPTFIKDEAATFIRFMSRGAADDVDRTLELLDWHELNEFKRTVVPR
jgi:protein-disulfide isomerase-like protein with CxxC motif